MTKAIFPGSFDPFTVGHYDIVERATQLFDHITIGIGHNADKKDNGTAQERLKTIEKLFEGNSQVDVQLYEGLTVDFAREVGAQFILRGVRNTTDGEYERQMADANRDLGGIETVVLYTRPEYAHISSSLVRDVQAHGRNVSQWLPQPEKK
ncbi:MAG: pantetheine-phosphate adenylyltransferase [Paludibacteraceae bacterium]|nr:pantetheine-phosphate adenylyltransferase [Paludibacteraceae bacterium]